MSSTLSTEAIVAAVNKMGINSTNRLEAFLDVAASSEPEVFWPAFQAVWSICDATWRLQKDLYAALTSHGPSHTYLEGGDLAFWQSLPEEGTIFRGGDWKSRGGMSWTTNKEVAEHFARGHQGITYSWPVVLEGSIRKRSILTVVTDRSEHEVIVRPNAVRKGLVHRWFEITDPKSGNVDATTRLATPVPAPWR